MRATLWGVPSSVSEELMHRLRAESGQAVECHALADADAALPDVIPPGLVVLWDAGGPLEEVASRCWRLHARRPLARTHLVVLTSRDAVETRALAEAGADECLMPPGTHWGTRWAALCRRVGPDGHAWMVDVGAEPQRVRPEEALVELLASSSTESGSGFFRSLVTHLTRAFRVECALVGELLPDGEHLRTLALGLRGQLHEDVILPLPGTACQVALAQGICHLPDGAVTRFPEDTLLSGPFGIRGFLGMALRGSGGDLIGVVALLHDRPLAAGPLDYALLDAFAARAGSELERLRVQADLERARDFLGNTLDAVPDPLFVKDRAHRWVAVNEAFCRFMGRSAEELVGHTDAEFVPHYEAGVFRRQAERAFHTRAPTESEQDLTDASGTHRTLFTKMAVFTGARGEPFLVGVIRDITERKRLEGQLRLADRMASVGTLAAGVAHEINNPLAYVSANLSYLGELLAEPTLADRELADMREAVAEALEGTGRVRTIVQDLRAFARADEEQYGPVEVHPVLDGALRLVRSELQHRARLVREDAPVPAVLGNAVRLGQVFINLFVNALQAFPERPAADNRLRVATRTCAPGWVEVEVEDNGGGMSPEVQQRIFDPFFTTKPAGVGSGLGLAICHTIVQAMGGTIEVRSTLGRGTTFRLVLPACQEREDAVAPAREAREEEGAGRRARLLLVDDEPSVGSAVQRLLHGMHEVDAVEDAHEALRRVCRGEAYDAVLCDVMMPGMSGVEFVAQLERVAPGLALRTGFMTGGAFTAEARESLEAHPRELLHKPFEAEGLRAFVARLLR